MSNNNKVFSIGLEFMERIQYDDSVKDTHIFTIYEAFNIHNDFNFDDIKSYIKREFKDLLEAIIKTAKKKE